MDILNIGNKDQALLIQRRILRDFLLLQDFIGENIIIEDEEIPIIVPPVGILSFPSDDVTPAIVFGISPNAGTSAKFSRGDHVHGTPSIVVDGVTITGTGKAGNPLVSHGGGSGTGDMLKSTYDPLGKNSNAFNVDNHVSGSINKVFTTAEQSKLAGITSSGVNTGDETTLSIKTKLGIAASGVDGYLTKEDFQIFVGKQEALGFTPIADAPANNNTYGRKNNQWIITQSASGGTGVLWGDITGDISLQSDLQGLLSGKVDKITGKGLSTEDFTTAEKNKLAVISGTNTGDETTVSIKTKLGIVASGADGYLTKEDFQIFTAKQSALGYTPENVNNKVTSISVGSTDTQYPSAKLLYDQLNLKVDKEAGKGLSTSDYSIIEKNKLASVASGATVYTDAMADARVASGITGKQDLDSDLTAIAGLSPTNDDIIQRKSGAWTNRSIAQLKTDMAVNNVDNTSDANKPISTAQQNIMDSQKEPTGFINPELVVVTYNASTQKITLTGTVSARYHGTLIPAITSGYISEAHPNVTGHVYYLYHDGTNFIWGDNAFPGFDKILIAFVFYRATAPFAVRECHGLQTWQCHQIDHYNIGTYRISGGDITGVTLASTTASQRRPDVSECTIFDEDLQTINSALTSKLYSQRYMTLTNTINYNLGSADIVPLSGNNPYYNAWNGSAFIQTLLPSNGVMTVWLYEIPVSADTDSQKIRHVFVQGQSFTQAANGNASSLLTARNTEKVKTSLELNLGDPNVVSAEYVVISKFIIVYTSSNWYISDIVTITGNKANQTGTNAGSFLSSVIVSAPLTGTGLTADPIVIPASASGTDGYMSSDQAIKLAGIASGANLYVHPNHSGDVTSSGDGAQTIALKAVTLAKMADLSGISVIGKHASGAGTPEEITMVNLKTMLNYPTIAKTFTFVLHRGENATTGAGKTNTLVVTRAMTIIKAYAYANTAPTGAALLFDINVGGSTIWSNQANRLTIADGQKSGTQTSFNTTTLAENDLLTIDIDQIGSTIAGSDITVELDCTIN